VVPGLAMFFGVLGFNLLGDGLRDVLDPRMRRGLPGPMIPGPMRVHELKGGRLQTVGK